MKNFTVILLVLISCSAFGQKQKEKDVMQAQIDALTKTNKSLTDSVKMISLRLDSSSTELNKYYGLYTVIKEKVVKMDFDPAKMSQIIDSLKSGRDSLSLSAASSVMLHDSLRKVTVRYDSILKENTGLMYTVNILKGGPGVNPTSPEDFTGTLNLILRKVRVVGQPPQTGIVDISSEVPPKTATFLETNRIISVTFIDKEFAEFTFNNGEKGKCYYVVGEFSKDKPYYIDFKGTKVDIRMYFMHTPFGPRISFQIPGVKDEYYFGQITK